jgi:sec-independent protein translocase protein TatA
MGPLGFQELIVIFVIALLVFGPKKLPELGKSLGKGIREFKKATDDMKANWDDHIRDVEEPIKEVRKDLQETSQSIKDETSSSNGSQPEDPAVPKEETNINAGTN